jgi:hypothetical protein
MVQTCGPRKPSSSLAVGTAIPLLLADLRTTSR